MTPGRRPGGTARRRLRRRARGTQGRSREHPDLAKDLDDPRGGSRTLAEHRGLLALAFGNDEASHLEPRRGTLRCPRLDRLSLRAELPRYRRVARQVEALLDRDEGGQ